MRKHYENINNNKRKRVSNMDKKLIEKIKEDDKNILSSNTKGKILW
jgi:hypothetical protein